MIPSIRRAAVLACTLLCLLALPPLLCGCLGRSDPDKTELVAAADNADRLACLTELGWEVDPAPLKALVLQLPGELQEAFGDYLQLQEQQGFSFQDCAGKTVSRYTYAVRNYPGYDGPVQIDLWVCGGSLVGGDVTAPGQDGFVAALTFPG